MNLDNRDICFCFVCFSHFFPYSFYFLFVWGGIIIVSIQYNRAGLMPMYLGRVFVAFTGFLFCFYSRFLYHRDRDYFRSIFLRLISNFFFYIASQIYERPKGSNKNLCFSRKPNLIGSDLKKCTQRVISPIFFFITNVDHFFFVLVQNNFGNK